MKLIMFILMLLFSVSVVNAIDSDEDLFQYLQFEDNGNLCLDSSSSLNDCVNTGVSQIASKNSTYGFAGDFTPNDYLDNGITPKYTQMETHQTKAMWVKFDATSTQMTLMSGYAGANREFYFIKRNTNILQFIWFNTGNTNYVGLDGTTGLTSGVWYHIAVVTNGSINTLYLNGNIEDQETAISGTPRIGTADDYFIGRLQGTTSDFNGQMDEIVQWNRSLSQSEIQDLMNNKIVDTIPTPIITIDDISLVNNSYHNSNLDIQLNLTNTSTNSNINSSYSLNGGTYTQFGTNTLQPNVSLLSVVETPKQNTRFLYGATAWNHATATKYCNDNYNLNYISYDIFFPGGIVDVTYYNNITWINATSTSYITNLHCGLDDDIYNITFQVENNETQTNSSQYTFTIDTTNPSTNVITNQTEFNTFQVNMSEIFNYSDTNLDTCSITLTELENVSVNDTDTFACDTLYNFSTAGLHNLRINVTDLAGNYNDTTEYNITINPYIYIYFRDNTNSTLLTSYDLTIYHPDGREVIATVQTNGSTILSPVNNGTLDIGLHTLEFSRLGYATENFTYNVTDSSAGDSQVFNVTRSKIILSIYDRETGSILTGLSTITLIATNGFNSTTTTGYLNISQVNFLAEQYQVIVSHDGYATESVYFDYDNQENLPVSIYLLNSTSTIYGTAIIELTADTGQLIQGAVCKALEWKPAQSAFVSVAEGLTNSNGQTTLNIELNTKLYKFSCEKDSTLVLSPQQIITTTGTTIPLEMAATVTTDYNIFTTLTYSFTNTTYNASHDTITFTWSENNGLVAQGCINIYTVKGTRKTLLSSNCATGSTSQKQVVTSINNSYNKQVEGVIIDVNGQSTKLDTIYYKSYYDLSRSLADYHLDIILPLLAVLIGIAIGLVLSPQNIYISQITVIILIWITAGLVPTVISGTIAVSVTMIAGLMLWGGFKVK